MTSFEPRFLRPYYGSGELPKLLQFVGECNARTHFCGYLHVGDVCHLLINLLRGRDLAKHCHIYEDAPGNIVGLVLLYPSRYTAYEVIVHPDYRSDLESALIAWSEHAIEALLQADGSTARWIGCDAMDCDTIHQDILHAQGYETTGEPAYFYTSRPLSEAIPASVLPEGFTIRSVEGEHEADALGDLHAAAFASRWQPGEYLNVMRAPSFHIERELVVVAPDGRLVAFLVYWVDPITSSALFEPVGCHPDFQRRGLTKALLYEGLRRMVTHGLTTALVRHEAPQENPASTALYRSVGFTPMYAISTYRKPRA